MIVELHTGGLGPLERSSHENKYTFSNSTTYQAVEGRNQTAESNRLVMLWRIVDFDEKFCTYENYRHISDNTAHYR